MLECGCSFGCECFGLVCFQWPLVVVFALMGSFFALVLRVVEVVLLALLDGQGILPPELW